MSSSRSRRARLLLAGAALLSAAPLAPLAPLAAQGPQAVAPDSAFLASFRWRNIGPDRGGRSIASSGVVGRRNEAYFGADRRRALEDDGRRRDLVPGDRRTDHLGLGRRGRGERVEPRPRLHRHGRVGDPRQHHARRRRLQVERCGQDLGARRLPRRARDLEDPHPPDQPRHRLRRGLRQVQRAERPSAASSRAPTAARTWKRVLFRDDKLGRGGHRDRPHQPERDVRGALGGVPQGIHRCRRAARARGSTRAPTAARPGPRSRATRPAHGAHRPHRRRAHRGQPEPRLRPRREREGRPLQER
jgi:hypothetical protein